jgi:DNA-binding MarR family transcriptional regulator
MSRDKKGPRTRAEEREQNERELVTPVTGEGAEVGWALRAVLTRHRDVTREVASRLSLPTTDVSALEHLMQEPTLGPVELAHRLGITTASTSVLVDRLERAGHLVRKPHASDGRRRSLEVTPHAQAEVFGVLAPLFRALEQHDASYSAKEQAVVQRYLRGVVEVYDRFLDDA